MRNVIEICKFYSCGKQFINIMMMTMIIMTVMMMMMMIVKTRYLCLCF